MRPLASLLLALLLALSAHPRDGRPQSRMSLGQGTELTVLAAQLPATIRSLVTPSATLAARQHAPAGDSARERRFTLHVARACATTVVASRGLRLTARALVAPYDATAPPLRHRHTNLA